MVFGRFFIARRLVWRRFSKPGSIGRELADVSCASHGMFFDGSLMPLEMVNGGTLLKWMLIGRGWTADEADRQVRRAGIAAGIGVGVTAVVGLLLRWMGHCGEKRN